MRRFLLFAALLAASCGSDPATQSFGDDYASQRKYIDEQYVTERLIAMEGGLLPEPAIYSACREVFERVATGVPEEERRGFRYHLYITTSPDLNAYTYGAGRIHCHLGLLARCNDAAEFAGVVAHEMAHNSHDHIGKSYRRQAAADSFFSFGGIFGASGRRFTQRLGSLVTSPFLVQYTRAQETEADASAVDYTVAAGIDPDGSARFFEGLQRDFGGGSGPELFQSHPNPRNRVKQIRKRIDDEALPPDLVRSTPAFDAAVKRAREILPYYEKLADALTKDKTAEIHGAADAGIAFLPHHGQFHFWKGIAYEVDEKRDEGLESLRKAALLDKTNVLVSLVQCILEFDSKNWMRAAHAANTTITLVPIVAPAYFVRGVSLFKLGKKKEAYADFDLLMKAAPRRNRNEILAEIRKMAPDYEYRPDDE